MKENTHALLTVSHDTLAVTQEVTYLVGVGETDRQTDRQADRQTGRQADRQTDRQTDTQIDR